MCVIVDEQNNVIGAATRRETVSQRLLGRGAYVLVFDSSGQLFVSRRSMAKDCYPGCLDVTISGVVNQGEEYADTAARELQEEIGMPLQDSRSSLQQLLIFPYQDATCHVFGCAFRVTWDGPVTFADAEVEWGRFMQMQELQQLLQDDPEQFTPVGRHILGLYAEQQQKQQGQTQ
ncbi:hypothetical protein OEZ85_002886 [Tetradesmus obliquus]|uniref:Nudix hydrolase domain-containing protein n=1 Tax=Tetradesmus obliquus TaxID=3088 RepID=A0ABY8U1L0_TETOB|nr:hypothetical protein OEZ85_002886 [Tetradesmus obliquus]